MDKDGLWGTILGQAASSGKPDVIAAVWAVYKQELTTDEVRGRVDISLYHSMGPRLLGTHVAQLFTVSTTVGTRHIRRLFRGPGYHTSEHLVWSRF